MQVLLCIKPVTGKLSLKGRMYTNTTREGNSAWMGWMSVNLYKHEVDDLCSYSHWPASSLDDLCSYSHWPGSSLDDLCSYSHWPPSSLDDLHNYSPITHPSHPCTVKIKIKNWLK